MWLWLQVMIGALAANAVTELYKAWARSDEDQLARMKFFALFVATVGGALLYLARFA